MAYQIRKLTLQDKPNWNALHQEHGLYPFSDWNFCNVYLEANPQYQLAPIGIFEQSRLVGGMLCFIKQFGIWKRMVTPTLFPYLPIVISREIDPSTLPKLIDLLSIGMDQLLITFAPENTSYLSTLESFSKRKTLIRNLINKDHFLAELPKKRRYEYRKMRETLAVNPSFQVGSFLDLQEESYGRHQRRLPLPRKNYEQLIHSLLDSPYLMMFDASDEMNIIQASCCILVYKKRAFLWSIGSKPGLSSFFLMIEIMGELFKQGYEFIDFMGGNTPSIASFKKKFNPIEVSYLHLEASNSPLISFAQKIRKCNKK